mmetsp:Transcript_68651/g.128066  ORF Transcript_68651/g.128066 Transcript_68651/m.128066 type:complete len:121 (+) Transcript_68651:67-429(+)
MSGEHDGAGAETQQKLLAAASAGDVSVCEEVLARAPKTLEACDQSGKTALLHAAQAGHASVCRLLLQKHADVEATDKDNGTPLRYACRAKHQECIALLLDYGAEVEATDCVVRDAGCQLL